MRLLFVCTGNVCRSPLAAGLAAAWAAPTHGHSGTSVQVLSAGVAAWAGEPMDPHSAAALERLGGHPATGGAVRFVPESAEAADLVLTMTRHQRRAVLEQTPGLLRRTFTLVEAADLLHGADLRGLEFLPAAQRARELGLRLDARRAYRPGTDADDVIDPIGHRAPVHDSVAETIAEALRPLAAVLFLVDAFDPPRQAGGLLTVAP
jgi:protein-tyrosine phosphatase